MSLVCINADDLEILAQQLLQNLPEYDVRIPIGNAQDANTVQLWSNYATQFLKGAADCYSGQPYTLALPIAAGNFSLLEAVEWIQAAAGVQWRYLVQAQNTLQVLLNLRITLKYNQSIDYANGIYTQAQRYANTVGTNANDYADGLYNNAVTWANTVGTNANDYADGLYNKTYNRATTLYNDAIRHANNLAKQDIHYTNVKVSGIEGKLANIGTTVNQLVAKDLAGVNQRITNLGTTTTHQVANALKTSEQFATVAAAAAVPTAVAQAVAQLQPQIDKLATEQDECLEPLCDTVTPNASQLGNLGKLLSLLTDASLLGLLLAVLEEAHNDPAQLAADAENDLGGIVSDALQGVRDLVGV